MSDRFTVWDGTQAIEFKGELLAESTSDDGRAKRWTELELYRADSGRYLIYKIGRSVVYHAPDSTCTSQAKPIHDFLGRSEMFDPCVTCRPQPANDVLVEQDRKSTTITEKPRGVIEALHGRDENSTLFLTNTARYLLERAIQKDEPLRAAWEVRTV